MITPGEAKRGYKFIKNILENNLELKQTELDEFLLSVYNEYKDNIDKDNFKYIFKDKITNDNKKIFVMDNFYDYLKQDEASYELYIKQINNLLLYFVKDDKIIEKINKLYVAKKTEAKKKNKEEKDEYIEQELSKLIGLEKVKKQIREIANWAYVSLLRKEKGLKSNNITMHMAFTGNPGTGKTTIARIIADLYYKLGIIKENKLIEVSREDLVAEYLGQSETKTKKVLEESLGGVLFIDEAYSLTENEDQYGSQVIDVILKFMEDHRDDTVIIIAGYKKEMDKFIKSNPGLKSRFNTFVEFDNYTTKELFEILQLMIHDNEYKIDTKELNKIEKEIDKIDTQEEDFSNARYIRNMFENAIKRQSSRVVEEDNIDDDALQLLKYEDFFE